MFFILANVVVLVFATFISWCLSAYDAKVTGADEVEGHIRRGIRCGISLLLVEIAFWCLWQYWRYDDRACGMAYLATSLPLALVWAGCISEMFARGFHWLIDPEDKREFDSKDGVRELDAIAVNGSVLTIDSFPLISICLPGSSIHSCSFPSATVAPSNSTS